MLLSLLFFFVSCAPSLFSFLISARRCLEFFVDGRAVPEPAPDAAGFAHLCLVVDDVQAALAHMTSVGATISRPYFEGRAGQKVFFVGDPDGNQIEIMEIRPDSPIYRG